MDESKNTNEQVTILSTKVQAEVEKMKLQLMKAEFKPTKSLMKRKVLEEEEYENHIESIIERDFYPDVTKLRLELEYQEALDNNDYQKLQQLGKEKFNFNNRPNVCDTPLTFDTPFPLRKTDDIPNVNQEEQNESIETKETSNIDNLSLNAFLNKYTSEDNASFEQLQEEAKRKHIEKIAFLCKGSKTHNEKVEQSLTVPSIESQVLTKAIQYKPKSESGDRLVSWKYTDKNTVMFDPEGVPLTSEESLKLKSNQVTILHENTRLKPKPFVVPNQPAKVPNILKQGRIGVDGKEQSGNVTPSVNGFKFVPSTPSLGPENLPQSPLMTWGEIECTPMSIRGDATPLIHPNMTPSSQFKIPDVSQREKIGQELANKLLSNKRKENSNNVLNRKIGVGGSMNKSSMERLDSMSPAARMLATKKLGLGHMDRSLQASYSPMMSSSFRSQTPTPRQMVTPSPILSKSTPGAVRNISNSSSSTSRGSTSNQLHKFSATKRSKASEFF